MPIVKCRECSGLVSTEAKSCPHCGTPHPRPARSGTNPAHLLLAGVLLAAVLASIVSQANDNHPGADAQPAPTASNGAIAGPRAGTASRTQLRASYAIALEKTFLEQGRDVTVEVSEPSRSILTMSYVLAGRVFAYQMEKNKDAWRRMGFREVRITNGDDYSTTIYP